MTKDEAYKLAVRKMEINKVGIGHLQAYYQEFLRADEIKNGYLEIIELVNYEAGAKDENRHRKNDRDTSNVISGIRKREKALSKTIA